MGNHRGPVQATRSGVVSVGTKLVVVGGMDAEQKISAEVDVYDTETKKWSKGAAHPGDAFGISVTSDGSAVFASGREGILRKWTPGEDKWTDVRKLAFSRFFHETRPMGSDLVFVGGIGGMHTRGRTAVVEKLPKDSSLTFGQMQFAYPGSAKNRQGILQNGEQLYFFGGNVSLEQHDFEVKHFSDEGWRLDLATLTFTSGPRFPLRRQSMQTLSTETGGFVFGGFGHEPQAGEKTEALSHPELFSFDWEKSSWAPAGALPRGRTQFGVVEGAGKIWILGGLNYDPNRKDSFQHDQSIWVAEKPKSDSDALQFEVADIELPGPRRAFAGAALNGKYYLVGGMKEGFQLVDDCLEFDFESRNFTTIPCPAPRLSGDLVPAGGKLYLVGGSVKGPQGIEESRTVEVFDPGAKTWSKVDFEIPFSTRHLRALPYRDQILLETTHFEGAEMSVGVLNPGK